MRDRPAADRTAQLLLWFVKEPLRYRTEVRRRDLPPLDSEVVLKLALGRRVELTDPALSKVSSASWREAATEYVRQVFFRPEATPYQTLGLASDATPQAIKEHFRLLMQLVHPDRQGARALWPEAFAAQANRAYGILRHAESRAELDREEAARVERARVAQHKAAAAARMPTPRWPPADRATRRPPPPVVLPEWLTAGLAGFMRQHPALVAFVALLSGAVLVVSAVIWGGDSGSLTRVAPAPSTPIPAQARVAGNPIVTAPATEATTAVRAPSVPRPAPAHPAAEPAMTPQETWPTRVASAPSATVPAQTGAVPAPPIKTAEPAVTLAAPTPAVPMPAPQRVAAEVVTTPAEVGPRREGQAPLPTPVAAAGATVVQAEGDRGTQVALATPPTAAGSNIAPTAPTGVGARQDAAHSQPPPLPDMPAAQRVAATPPTASPPSAVAAPQPLTMAEIDALSAAFVDAYDRGRLDTFAALFDNDAETNLNRGRAAIRNEYSELFRLSEWRRMQLKQIEWRRVGERAYAKGEIAVRIAWRDGREVEQRVAIDMEVARRDGRVVITRLAHKPSAP